MTYRVALAASFFFAIPALAAPLVPSGTCQYDALGWGSFFQVIQNVLNFSITLAIFFAVLLFAYAGFLWVTTPTSSGNISKGREILTNAIIGLVVILAAWLIVDTAMKALVDPGKFAAGGYFGPWNSIVNGGGPKCITFSSTPQPLTQGGGLTGNPSDTGGDGSCPGYLICTASRCQSDPDTDNGKGTAGEACKHGADNCASPLVCDNTDVCSASATSADPIPASCSVTPEPDQGGSGANCPVPAQSTMASLPAADVISGTGLATSATVQNYIAMRAAALKAGIDLKVTSAYRSNQTQVDLWNQYCSSGTCGATKVAKPCSLGGPGSNHNSGEALDLTDGCHNGQSNCNTAAYNWLKTNGGQFNFRNAVPTDPVHWSPDGH